MYSVGYYEQTLPFYLHRTIDVVDYRGELDFGLGQDPWRAISLEAFRTRWRDEADACAILPRQVFQKLLPTLPMTILDDNARFILVARP